MEPAIEGRITDQKISQKSDLMRTRRNIPVGCEDLSALCWRQDRAHPHPQHALVGFLIPAFGWFSTRCQ